jgi:hypothetical protein
MPIANTQQLDPISALIAAILGGDASPPASNSRYDPQTGDFLPPGSYDTASAQGSVAGAAGAPAPSPAAHVASTQPMNPLARAIAGRSSASPQPDTSNVPVPTQGPYGAPAVTGGNPLAPPSDSPSGSQRSLLAGGASGAPPAVGLNAAGGAISVPGYDGRFTRAQANDADGVPSQAEWDAAASNRPVPPSAPSEDATTAAYRGLHDNLAAMRDRSLAMARATAGTDASAQYLKLADRYEQEANEISLKAIEYGKPEAPKGPIKVSPGDTLYDPTTGSTTTPVPAQPDKPVTEIVKLSDGTYQTINKATGDLIGSPVGHPTQAPRPVTDEERKTYALPTEGAFTIAPGEAPKAISGAGVKDQPLDQATLDWLANRLNQGDSSAVTNLGFGSAGNRAAVVKRAAELAGASTDAAGAASTQIGNQVGLGGLKQAGRTSGALGARIDTFAEEAKQTVPQALQASDAVPRGQWVPINTIEQMGEAAASNPALSRFQAANNALANTYAKAVNPTGVPTDESRRAAFSILNMAKSPQAYGEAVHQLEREMMIVQNAIHKIGGQYGNAPQPVGGAPTGAPSPAAPRIRTYNPATGNLE